MSFGGAHDGELDGLRLSRWKIPLTFAHDSGQEVPQGRRQIHLGAGSYRRPEACMELIGVQLQTQQIERHSDPVARAWERRTEWPAPGRIATAGPRCTVARSSSCTHRMTLSNCTRQANEPPPRGHAVGSTLFVCVQIPALNSTEHQRVTVLIAVSLLSGFQPVSTHEPREVWSRDFPDGVNPKPRWQFGASVALTV